MTYLKFCKYIEQGVKDLLRGQHHVSVQNITKNNGVKLKALLIKDEAQTVAPLIYLEGYFNKNMQVDNIVQVCSIIVEQYNHNTSSLSMEIPNIGIFQEISNKVYFKLINYESNKEQLKDTAYIKWLDMAIVFSILIKLEDEGTKSTLIKNKLMELWDITPDILLNLAKENTKKLFGYQIESMEDTLLRLEEGQDYPRAEDVCSHHSFMYVLSNRHVINGAACLLYQEELREFATRIGKDLYILPSSIHEVILVPSDNELQKNQFKDMVNQVNNECVSEEEILSNNVYYYDYKQDTIKIL